jgi:hypothetical protein
MSATAAGYTDDLTTVNNPGFAAGGPRSGVLKQRVTIGGNLSAANARAAVFTLTKPYIVKAAWINVVTPSTNAVTGSIGLVTSEDGSATTLAGEMATNGAAGVPVYASIDAPVLVPAASQVVFEISADAGAAGVIEVFLDATCAV